MRLSFFSGRPSADEALSEFSPGPMGRARRIMRSKPPRPLYQQPEPPPLDNPDARVRVSTEAAYLMAGDRYDPASITPNEIVDMTEILLAGRVITRGDQAVLLNGPTGGGYPPDRAGTPRDLIADWQSALAASVGRSNLNGISRATQALGILGRVAATRMPG